MKERCKERIRGQLFFSLPSSWQSLAQLGSKVEVLQLLLLEKLLLVEAIPSDREEARIGFLFLDKDFRRAVRV